MSLRARLVLLVVGLLALLLGGLGLYLGPALVEWSREAQDDELRRRADAIESELEVRRSGALELEVEHGERRGWPLRVESADGRVLLTTGFDWPPLAPLAPGQAERTETVETPGGTFRVLSRLVEPEHAERLAATGQRVTVRLAAPAGAFAALGQRFQLGLIAALAVGLLLGAIGALVVASMFLAPLRRLSSEVVAIEERTLGRRLSTAGLDPELRRLADAFNGVLERLEQAFERQKQLVARASHSLRTPTASILSVAEIALRRQRSPDEYRAALLDIAEAARESSALSNAILAASRADASAAELRRESIPAKELAMDVARLFTARAEQAGIALRVDAPEGFTVHADRSLLRELLDALLDNAIRYTPRGGSVGVASRLSGAGTEIEVWDTGPGIPPAERAQVFERFYRGSTAAGTSGSGLGLSIARAIAEAHGGSIAIEERPGGGARVVVRLPA